MLSTSLGIDLLSYSVPAGRFPGPIEPGAIHTDRTWKAEPDAVSAHATVTGVVYADRTWEGTGNGVQPIFQTRVWLAGNITKAQNALGGYPATPESFRNAIAAARTFDPPAVDSVLYEKFGAPLTIATDDKHPLPFSVPIPDEQHWRAALAALSDEAAFWAKESKEAGK